MKQAQAAARVTIAPMPDECSRDEPHALLTLGLDVLSVLKLERVALDRANASKRRCTRFHEDQRKALR